MARVHDLLDRWIFMERRKNAWMPYFQELGDVLLPERADFTRAFNPGDRRNDEIFDATPRLQARNLASVLDGLLKPKTTPWFEPDFDDEPALKEDEEVIAWADAAKKHLWRAIYARPARFVQASGESDLALTVFGTGPLWLGENKDLNGLLFKSLHLRNASIEEDADGQVNVLSVKEELTARKAIEKHGAENVSKQTRENAKQTRTDATTTFVELILPRDDEDSDKIFVRDMPYSSVTIDVVGEHIIGENGYFEFPAAVPRWDTAPEEVYGRSPGMWALPDSYTLQAMGKTLLLGAQRAADPSVWIDGDSAVSAVRLFPGGVTVVDTSQIQSGPPMGVLQTAGDLPIGREFQQDYRLNVEKAFFGDILNLPRDGPEMTATEVLKRDRDFVQVLGPVFGRLEADYPGHIVERSFAIEERAGRSPPRPEILQGLEIKWRLQSPIQEARKHIEIAGLSTALERLAPLAQWEPEIMDNFDGDEIARDSPDWAGVALSWLRSKDGVKEVRDRRSQQENQQALIDQAGQGASAIADIAKATRQ